MKFTCGREELAQKLAVVSRATTGSGSIAALGGIKITTGSVAIQDAIILEATNLEMTVRTEFSSGIHISEAGQAVVHGKILADAIKKMPGHAVDIIIDDQKATIEARQANGKACKCNLPVFQVEEFPDTIKNPDAILNDTENNTDFFRVKSKALCEAIKKTAYATLSKDDSKPFLTAINFSIDGEKLEMVGTDAGRLAIYQMRLDDNQAGNISFMAPVKALKEIETIFGKVDDLYVSIDQHNLLIRSSDEAGSTLLSARLLESQYPNYRLVIPKDPIGRVKVNRDNFIKVLERVHLVSNEIVLSFRNEPEKTIYAAGQEADKGSVFDEISVIEMDGEDLKVGFNIRFLLDYLKVIDCETVEMEYQSPQKPAALRGSEENGDQEYLYIAMPVKVAESSLALVA
jgi:DNA polymerase-3 subunit beta